MTGSTPSAQGRRVLVAPVTGPLGDRIQAWRTQWDPDQALRLPPHVTLCYWPPFGEAAALEAQVRHAFPQPVAVWLGDVREFDSQDGTFYVTVEQTGSLDAARERLYDASHLPLGELKPWTWHVTCVRYARRRDMAELRRAAAELTCGGFWYINRVAFLELQGDRYVPVAEWHI